MSKSVTLRSIDLYVLKVYVKRKPLYQFHVTINLTLNALSIYDSVLDI